MLEAMACGTPLVAADIPAARWLSGGGRAALLLPPDDQMAWTTAIAGLLRGEDDHVASRVAAGLRRGAGFDWQRSARRLLETLYGAGSA
jgi:glycosyltransferase involved in cell wall biosynthesis